MKFNDSLFLCLFICYEFALCILLLNEEDIVDKDSGKSQFPHCNSYIVVVITYMVFS